jgi:hypothetical protein
MLLLNICVIVFLNQIIIITNKNILIKDLVLKKEIGKIAKSQNGKMANSQNGKMELLK